MILTLYSFRICPFIERINILLNEKNIHCERIFVDIRNKPDWFLKLSPLGKVPLLKANDTLIFESSVINDFLDEISPGSLHPSDPLERAYNKCWIEWGSTLIFDAYNLTLAQDTLSYDKQYTIVENKLALLEQELKSIPFFNGEFFSMVDIAYAPLFKRFSILAQQFNICLLQNHPKLKIWSDSVLARDSVVKGFHKDFDNEFYLLLQLKNSCLIKS